MNENEALCPVCFGKLDHIHREPPAPPREEYVEYAAYPPKNAPAGRVWIGTCGCGLTPEEHVAMSPGARRIHTTVPPNPVGATIAKARRSR